MQIAGSVQDTFTDLVDCIQSPKNSTTQPRATLTSTEMSFLLESLISSAWYNFICRRGFNSYTMLLVFFTIYGFGETRLMGVYLTADNPEGFIEAIALSMPDKPI